MEKQELEVGKCEGYTKRYLTELREKWLTSRKEEARKNYFNAVKEYNNALILEGEI